MVFLCYSLRLWACMVQICIALEAVHRSKFSHPATTSPTIDSPKNLHRPRATSAYVDSVSFIEQHDYRTVACHNQLMALQN